MSNLIVDGIEVNENVCFLATSLACIGGLLNIMVPEKVLKGAVLKRAIEANRRRRRMLQYGIASILFHRCLMLRACLFAAILAFASNNPRAERSCRRLERNSGWWELVWNTYNDERFKKTFRVSRETFDFILERLRKTLERETLCEEPISPELHLGLCLYRLGRGDYYYTLAEMVGLAPCTVSTVVHEVNEALVGCLWKDFVSAHMPVTDHDFESKILNMKEQWQFPFSWCAVDGCHIPIKCPGGQETSKEYHNVKNVHSIILMSIVDATYYFVWGSCGYPGNSRDSIILQSTSLWASIKEGKFLPQSSQKKNEICIPPLIRGDSAFPFESFLLKPYSNAVMTKEQRFFKYRLSRARMVVEGAYGQLKGRWHLLLKKSEGNLYQTKIAVLSCMVLHTICLQNKDVMLPQLDLTIDPSTMEKRDRATVCDVLLLTNSHKATGPHKNEAAKIRQVITTKLYKELQDFHEQ